MYYIKRYWRIIFPIFFICLSWALSATDGSHSEADSSWWASVFGLSNAFMRKLAHIFLFGAIAYSITSFVKGLNPSVFPSHSQIIYPIILTAVYAAIDEVHQITVVGRSGQVGDVFLDTIAGIGGVLVYIAIFCFFRRWRLRHAYRKYA